MLVWPPSSAWLRSADSSKPREKLAALSLQRRLPVTAQCSTGIAWSQSPPDTADEFLREADRDMHARKRAREDT